MYKLPFPEDAPAGVSNVGSMRTTAGSKYSNAGIHDLVVMQRIVAAAATVTA